MVASSPNDDEQYCPECGETILRKADVCPHCGVASPPETAGSLSSRDIGFILLGVASGAIAGLLVPPLAAVSFYAALRLYRADHPYWAAGLVAWGASTLTLGTILYLGAAL